MTIRWGVLGAGGIADRRTIPEGITQATDSKLVAVMDVDEGRARAVGEKYGVDWYVNAKDVLARSDVDAVYVATPVVYHAELVCEAARHGKHVLCEKPLAMNVAEAEKVIKTCDEQGVKLAVGYMMRFHGAHQKLKEMLDAGELGQPVLARAQLTCWYPPIPGAWRQQLALGGGGALMDMATHCIDLLEMLLGPVVSVQADVSTQTHDYEVDDSALILLRFESGAKAVVDSNFNVPDVAATNVLEIYGTKGSVIGSGTIGQDSGGKLIGRIEREDRGYDAQQARVTVAEELPFTPVNPYRAEVESLIKAIKTDTTPEVSGEVGLRNLKVALAAYEAARLGKAVRIS
ncbi:MAG: Gfo/Idh/MocA family oxidoreductase [Firmicutes bacterium]|nr:Gfo/Idh/MocA family oxidoreductase [Bacillota bacterium]